MKMTVEHYNRLKNAIELALDENPDFHEKCNQENQSPMARRWILWNIMCDRDYYSFARELWAYLNDDHIDTALRKITGII